LTKKTLAIYCQILYITQTKKIILSHKFLGMKQTEEKSSSVVLHKLSLWKRVKTILAQTFPYAIVYEDGLVSKRQWYAIKRNGEYSEYKPFGILFMGYIIKFNTAEEPMTFDEAEAYCQAQEFAGKKGELPSSEFISQIIKHYGKLHYVLDVMGETRISNGYYLTSTPAGVTPSGEPMRYAWHFTYTLPNMPVSLLKEEEGKALVVFKVK